MTVMNTKFLLRLPQFLDFKILDEIGYFTFQRFNMTMVWILSDYLALVPYL